MWTKKKQLNYHRGWKKRNKEKVAANARRYYHKNKEKFKRYRLKSKFGITLEQYEELKQLQNNKCAICDRVETTKYYTTGKIKELCVDHCHKSGKVRGLLCRACNYRLGWYEGCQEKIESYLKNN